MSKKSEKTENKLATVSVSLSEYDKLKDQIQSKQKEVDSLHEQIGDFNRTFEHMRAEKAKDDKVKIIHETKYGDTRVTYQNLPNLEKEAYELAKKELEDEINERTELQEEIKDLKLKLNEEQRKYSANLNEINHNNRNLKNEVRDEYISKLDKKEEQIKNLQKELHKVKNDKTDEQLEKARKKEISQLNKIIAQQQKQIEELQTRGWFRKLFERIVNFKSQIATEKELQKEREKLAEYRNQIINLQQNQQSYTYSSSYSGTDYTNYGIKW
jgi:DNA repair exonuclease SbcCD ATPase subunit